MATDVELPQLGESVTEGTITAWLVEVGDTVEADQPLFELSSDKIDTEVPSPAAGTVTEILVQVDETVEVGTVVARIGSSEDAEGASGGGDDGGDADGTREEATDAVEDHGLASDMTSGDGGDGGDGGGGGEPGLHAGAQEGGGAEGPEAGAPPEAGVDRSPGGGGDAVDVTLPELGESVTEGTITAWLVDIGDTVEVDQPIFELSSDKIDTEVPSPAAGTVSEILVGVDETVDVGTVVARLESGGGGGTAQPAAEGGAATDQAPPRSAEERAPSTDGGARRSDQPTRPTGSAALASPLVRNLARENDVDLDSLRGTGEGGRITREDIEAAIGGGGAARTAEPAQAGGAPAPRQTRGQSPRSSEPAAPARAPGERERVEDLSRIRQRIAEKMLESQARAAQLTTVQEADVTALMAARSKAKSTFAEREGASLSPFAMIARAAIIAVRDHPLVNAYADWDNGKLYLRDYVNLGIAVDTPKGLLVPNVKNADGLTVGGLARGIAEAAAKARGEGGRRIDFSDIEGGTFTLTNTGSRGVLIDTPILNYPEVAILGIGAIVKRPAVVTAADGSESIGIRQMMYLSLTYDHRLLDGADAARFVTDVKTVLETTDWTQELGV